jgi:hypothetical protein
MSNKKQCVSVRLKNGDLQKIEQIANRLNVKNSDVIRYAVKAMLKSLMPLHDDEVKGHRLLPMIIDHCCDLSHHFDLDADQLENIINADSTNKDECVQRHDIELLALCGLSPEHIQYKFQEITGQNATTDEIPHLLKEYLINKYEKQKKRSKGNTKTPRK